MIIAISGWKKSGKDHAASILKDYNFRQVSFAAPLKDMVAKTYDLDRESLDNQDLKEVPLLHLPVKPSDSFSSMIRDKLLLEFKYEDNTQFHPTRGLDGLYWTRRAILILEGSVKRSVTSSYWVSQALNSIKNNDLAVITDLRYKSEADQIRAYGESIGEKVYIIRIDRFDTSPSQDPSERDMDDYGQFDMKISNRGTLEEFTSKIEQLAFNLINK